MLIATPPRILVARDPVDFRKGIASLAAVREIHLGEQPLGSTLFLFRNRRGNGLQMLVWTHGGFLMLYERLEKETLESSSVRCPRACAGSREYMSGLGEILYENPCLRAQVAAPQALLDEQTVQLAAARYGLGEPTRAKRS